MELRLEVGAPINLKAVGHFIGAEMKDSVVSCCIAPLPVSCCLSDTCVVLFLEKQTNARVPPCPDSA